MNRSSITLGVVIVFALTAFVVSSGYSFSVSKPSVRLSDFPMEIEGWLGSSEEFKDGVADILDAHEMSSIRFVRGADGPVFVHAATWTNPDSVAETCPHHPNICYRGNGWLPVSRNRFQVDVPSIGKIPVEVNLMQRGDQKVVVAFCYRMGDQFFADETDARLVQLSLWGQKTWPAVTKFMVQTSNGSIEAAKPAIEMFVKEFFKWHKV